MPIPPNMKRTGSKSIPAMTNDELIFDNTSLAADIPPIKIIPVAISINAGLRSTLDLAVPKATPASIRLGAPDIETIYEHKSEGERSQSNPSFKFCHTCSYD
jgi:hypothetical protein